MTNKIMQYLLLAVLIFSVFNIEASNKIQDGKLNIQDNAAHVVINDTTDFYKWWEDSVFSSNRKFLKNVRMEHFKFKDLKKYDRPISNFPPQLHNKDFLKLKLFDSDSKQVCLLVPVGSYDVHIDYFECYQNNSF